MFGDPIGHRAFFFSKRALLGTYFFQKKGAFPALKIRPPSLSRLVCSKIFVPLAKIRAKNKAKKVYLMIPQVKVVFCLKKGAFGAYFINKMPFSALEIRPAPLSRRERSKLKLCVTYKIFDSE